MTPSLDKPNPYASPGTERGPPPRALGESAPAEPAGTAQRYRVLGLLCLVAGIAYVQRAAISVPAGEIAGDFGLSDLARDMGRVQSAWYVGYAIMQLPSGWIADRMGSRRTVAAFCVLWSVLTLAAGLSAGFWSLAILWGCMGAAQAGVFPCAAKAIGQIFPSGERARASGLLAAGMAVGGALGPVITAWALEALVPAATLAGVFRWRILLAIYAIPGVLWAGLFLVLVPSRVLPTGRTSDTKSTPVDWTRMLTSVPLILLCTQQFFRAAAMVFFLTWFPTFLQKTRDVSSLESGVLTTIAGIGGFLGSLAGGFASDWLLAKTGNRRLSRQGIAVAGMASCSLLIVLSYFAADVRLSISLIALGTFCAMFGGVSGYTVAIDFGGKHVATVFSTMNMCGNIGAALFPITAGWLVARTGDWNLILFLFAGIMALDAVCWAVLNPRGTLFGETDDVDHP